MQYKYIPELKQYYFSRDEFMGTFKEVFTDDDITDLEIACKEHRCADDFILYYANDEFYIIHLLTGTIINWYKHLGRCNTCNKENFTLLDLKELLYLVKESYGFNY